MHTWFECKVKYEKMDEQGLPKKVNEPYLVDALTFTEAEARICKEMLPFVHSGTDFQVANIKRANISEMIEDPSGDRWYRFRVITHVVDEEKGVEKKVPSNVYVQAEDIYGAMKNFKENYNSTFDHTVTSITETLIMDVYPYVPAVPSAAQPVPQTPVVNADF